MGKIFVSHKVNLAAFPHDPLLMQCNRITIGALNGNFLVLLHTLIKANIIAMDRDHYLAIVALLYDKTLTEDQFPGVVRAIEDYLKAFTVLTPKAHIQILSSDLAADGLNDYFTLYFLDQLVQKHFEVDIICSSHSLRFLEAYFQYEANGMQLVAKDRGEVSLSALNNLLQAHIIDFETLQRLVDNVYLHALKFASCSFEFDTNTSIVNSSLVASLEELIHLVKRHGSWLDLSTHRDLLCAVMGLNDKFTETIRSKGDFSRWGVGREVKEDAIIKGDFSIQFVSACARDRAPRDLAYNLWSALGSQGCLEETLLLLVAEDKKAARRVSLPPLSMKEADEHLLFAMSKMKRRTPPPPPSVAAAPAVGSPSIVPASTSSSVGATKRLIAIENVNIDAYPTVVLACDNKELTIGDLHGNALLLLHFLVREGVVGILPEQYSQFVTYYMTPHARMCREWREEYDRLVSNEISVLRTDLYIRLIGDELGDRGNNDYYVLKLLDVLNQKGLAYEILLSNHGMEFLSAYEQCQSRGWALLPSVMTGEHVRSLTNLNDWVAKGIVTPAELIDLVERSYKPYLRLVGCSLDKDHRAITLFSHAGVDIKLLAAIARKFSSLFFDDTPLLLAQSIQRLNQAFMRFVTRNAVYTLVTKESLYFGYCQEPLKWTDDDALAVLLWNRLYDTLNREPSYKDYAVSYVHGHDSGESSRDNIYNLDALLGKGPSYHSDTYVILASEEEQLEKVTRSVIKPSGERSSRSATIFSPFVIYPEPERFSDSAREEEGTNEVFSTTRSSIFG